MVPLVPATLNLQCAHYSVINCVSSTMFCVSCLSVTRENYRFRELQEGQRETAISVVAQRQELRRYKGS